MPPVTPSTELFGFSEPTVKSGEVFVPMRTVGGLAHLHGPQSLLVDLAHAILTATGAVLVRNPASHRVRVHGKGRGKGCWMTAERRALLDAALKAWEEGDDTQATVARRFGISTAALIFHRSRVREEAKKQRTPVTKSETDRRLDKLELKIDENTHETSGLTGEIKQMGTNLHQLNTSLTTFLQHQAKK